MVSNTFDIIDSSCPWFPAPPTTSTAVFINSLLAMLSWSSTAEAEAFVSVCCVCLMLCLWELRDYHPLKKFHVVFPPSLGLAGLGFHLQSCPNQNIVPDLILAHMCCFFREHRILHELPSSDIRCPLSLGLAGSDPHHCCNQTADDLHVYLYHLAWDSHHCLMMCWNCHMADWQYVLPFYFVSPKESVQRMKLYCITLIMTNVYMRERSCTLLRGT